MEYLVGVDRRVNRRSLGGDRSHGLGPVRGGPCDRVPRRWHVGHFAGGRWCTSRQRLDLQAQRRARQDEAGATRQPGVHRQGGAEH